MLRYKVNVPNNKQTNEDMKKNQSKNEQRKLKEYNSNNKKSITYIVYENIMDQIDSADGIARVLKSLMDAMRDNEDGQAQIRAVGEKYEKGSLEKLTAQLEKFVELRLQANPESRSKEIQGREGDLAKLIIKYREEDVVAEQIQTLRNMMSKK